MYSTMNIQQTVDVYVIYNHLHRYHIYPESESKVPAYWFRSYTMVVSRRILRDSKTLKMSSSRGFATDPTGEAHNVPHKF